MDMNEGLQKNQTIKNYWYYNYATTRRWWRKSNKEKELKILTPNKLLIRCPALLAQINNSYKLKNEIRQIVYFCICIIKSWRNFTTIWSNNYNNGSVHWR